MRLILSLATGFILTLALIFLAFSNPSLPQITAIFPTPNTSIDKLDTININFARPIAEGQIETTISPILPFSSTIDGRTLSIVFPAQTESPFPAATYTISLFYRSKLLQSWTYLYTPPSSQIPGQGDDTLYTDLGKTDLTDYPLLDFVPYSTANYYINYASPGVLIVKLKSKAEEATKLEVFDWIKSKGFDPYTMEFKWTR